MGRRSWRAGLVGSALLLVATPTPARAQDDLMVVEIHLTRVARELVEVPVLAGEPALPVVQVLRALEVPFEVEADRIVGHLGARARRFVIQGAERIVYREIEHVLGPEGATWYAGDLHLALWVWRDVLDIDLRFEPARLEVRLRPDTRLPVYRRLEMERARRYRAPYVDELEPADRTAAVHELPYAGHSLDWNVGTWNLLRPLDYGSTSWSATYGGDLFGGALRASGSGTVGQPLGAPGHLSWSRPFDHTWVREARFGTLTSPGLVRRPLVGFVVTNTPIYLPQRYGHADLPLALQPHTPVDVFLDGDWFDHYETGPAGLYDTQVPLRYGHNRLELRYLDAYGAPRSDRLLIRVPRGMLREGEIRYHLGSGRDRRDFEIGLSTMQVGWGATRWLSILGGGEIVSGRAEHAPGVYPFATGLFRLDRATHLHVSGALGNHLGVGVDHVAPNLMRLVASHREFQFHPVLQPSTFRRETALQASVPFEILDVPVGLHVQAREVHHRSGDRHTSVRALFLVRTPRLGHLVTGYAWRGDLFGLSHRAGVIQLRWSRSLPRQALGGALRLGLEFDPHEPHLERLSVAWGRYLRQASGVRADIGYTADRDLIFGVRHEVILSLRTYFDAAMGGTGLAIPSDGTARLQAQLSGNVSWGEGAGVHDAHRLPQADRGRIVLRLDGPPVPPGSYVFLVDGRRYPVDGQGEATIPSLVRERTYRVYVESTPRADPLLSPRYEEIDVHVRANRTVVVDVPLDENFELEGRVYTEPTPGVRRGLGLARVDLVDERTGRTRTLRTFQDGFLYDFGIPPGDWRIVPDPEQMHRRGLVVRPAALRIVHRPEDGIAVHGGVDFLAGPEEAMTDAALGRRILAALAAGDRSGAYATSRILLLDAPAEAGFQVAAHCDDVGETVATALGEALADLGASFVAAPSETAEGCVDLAFAPGPEAEPGAGDELETRVFQALPGVSLPLDAVLADDLLRRVR